MINFGQLDIDKLPFVVFGNFRDLPAKPGIYFVLGENGEILYIGQSANLSKRFWGQHHKLAVLNENSAQRIHWLLCDKEITLEIETAAISHFSPSLNIYGRSPKEEMYRFNLNLPRELLLRVEKMAIRNRRSITQQIISALEWTTREETSDEPAEHVSRSS